MMTKTICLVLFILSISSSCSRQPSAISYIGEPSTDSATVFAAGIVSTPANEHSALAFSPDGSTALWAVMDKNYRGSLVEMKFENGSWTKPITPSFADSTVDHFAPSFSPDGSALYFSSRRDVAGLRTGRGNRIWKVSRKDNQWGTPTPIDTIVSKGEEFSHSISGNGSIYFSSALDGKNMDIHYATWNNEKYNTPVSLPAPINSDGYEDGPFIATDESYLLFESTRAEGIRGSHDIYISFKNKNGNWGSPVNLGPRVNSEAMERFPTVSPDGKYLFFASNRDQSNGKSGYDFYWIDAKIIEDLRGKQ